MSAALSCLRCSISISPPKSIFNSFNRDLIAEEQIRGSGLPKCPLMRRRIHVKVKAVPSGTANLRKGQDQRGSREPDPYPELNRNSDANEKLGRDRCRDQQRGRETKVDVIYAKDEVIL
ncbi:hypothetical protein EVAR_49438_1 [Eumeta japonica]|uniref:Uncharacterized protein n=1 Tax=Eumeta variegata TaxID=151549 RepID=A0A4C1Y5N4_EUMVA|nr:hypothetical protein EVAR_49438_1 [Eumeta japonica]